MTSFLRVWLPKVNVDRPNLPLVLAVPYNQSRMKRSLYEALQEQKLREEIEQDPEEARRNLEMSLKRLPNFQEISTMYHPSEWPTQIVMSDQMQMLLNQVDWKSPGRVETRQPSSLPGLQELLEAMP